MSKIRSKHCAALWAVCAIVTISVGLSLAPRPAGAQFVCTNFNTGTASGADATGGVGNFACGPTANASGGGSSGNTARIGRAHV